MRNIFTKIFLLPIVTLFAIVLLSRCQEDTDCEAIVEVRFLHDTTKPVINGVVYLRQNDDKGGFRDSGMTSTSGQFTYTKALPAIVTCEVLVDTLPHNDYQINKLHFYGKDLLRLKEGELTKLRILVDTSDIPEEYWALLKK